LLGPCGWPVGRACPKLAPKGGGGPGLELIGQAEDQVDVRLSLEELVLLRNVLNEICNGMEFTDNDFAVILDTQRSEAEDLLMRISSALDRLKILSE
jgi:hypothetical protein